MNGPTGNPVQQCDPNDQEMLRPKEYAEIIREMIRHENELTNQRVGWMATPLTRSYFATTSFRTARNPFVSTTA